MAEQAWNDLVARIGYTARTRDYLHSAAGINIPSTLVEATTLPGFDKFIGGLDKKASAFKLNTNQTEAHKPSFQALANRRLKAFRMYLEWQVLMGENIDNTADAVDFNVDQMNRWCKRTIFLEDEATFDDSLHDYNRARGDSYN